MKHTSLIPAYNGAEHISKTLECLIAQTGLTHHRIVVSDDMSNDDTGRVVTNFQKKIKQDSGLNSKVTLEYVRQEQNLGMVGNWNWVLDQAKTETFTMISQDDLLGADDTIYRCKTLMQQDENLIAVYSNVRLIDTEDNPLMANTLRSEEGYFDPLSATKKSMLTSRNMFGLPLCVSSKLGGKVRYSHDVLYAADVDYAARLSLGGNDYDPKDSTVSPLTSYHLSDPLFIYRVHIESATSKVQKHSRNDFKIIMNAAGIELNFLEKIRFEISQFTAPKLRAFVLKTLAMKKRLSK